MRTRTTIIFAVAALILSASAFASTGRAISLNALAASVKHGGSADAQHMCGVTKVLGYFVDPSSKDVVLVGKVDPNLPPLHLDDLAVALRSAWMSYIKVQNGIRYYYAPGCSIDPDPKVIRQLNTLRAPDLATSDEETLNSFSDSWKEVGSQPQSVRVMGVPFDSRFAKVMVDADYYMKRIVNGSVSLGIDGLESLTDMHTAEMKRMLAAGRSDTPGMTLNRFWFSPGETTYEVKDSISVLRSCPIRLLTEEEFLNEHGAIAGKGRPDPMAGDFAKAFTAKYAQIAEARPVYRELEGLFRFVALAKIMRADGAEKSAPNGLRYFLTNYKVAVVPVSRGVKGLTEVRLSKENYDTADGKSRTFSMIQTVCGGVSMDIKPRRVSTSTRVKTAPAVSAPAPQVTREASEIDAKTKSVTVDVVGKTSTYSFSTTPTSSKSTAKHRVVAKPVHRASLKHVVMSTRKSPKAVAWDFSLQDIGE